VAEVTLVLAVIAVIASIGTLVLILTLLGKPRGQYATKEDLAQIEAWLGRLGGAQSNLWRYVECVDECAGSRGHSLFIARVQKQSPPAGSPTRR
jgi:hypothetical protein